MNTDRNQKDSSFAGFLNEYSRGNVASAAATNNLNTIISSEVSKIVKTIDEIIDILDANKGNQLSEQLALAKKILSSEDDTNVSKLLSFSRVLEISLVLYQAILKLLEPDKSNKLSLLFSRLIVEFLTIVKKMGNSALLETAIRLIQQVDNQL